MNDTHDLDIAGNVAEEDHLFPTRVTAAIAKPLRGASFPDPRLRGNQIASGFGLFDQAGCCCWLVARDVIGVFIQVPGGERRLMDLGHLLFCISFFNRLDSTTRLSVNIFGIEVIDSRLHVLAKALLNQ